ncbi:hypothetical protein Tco_0970918 [Tanacetum coccineum]
MYPPPHLSQPQISHLSVPPSQQYQSHMDHQTSYVPLIAYNLPQSSTQPMNEFPQMDLGLTVHVFNQGDDLISCLNKAIAILTDVASSRVTVQQVQGRQGQSYAGTSYKGNATSFGANNAGVQTRVTEDLDAYDSDCDDVSNAKAVLMANLSNYGSDVILEVPHFEPYHTDLDNQSLHAMQGFEQTPVVDFTDNEITSDSNIIPQDAASPVIDDGETLILEEVSRSKMRAKQNDPMSKEKKVNTTPINCLMNKLFGYKLHTLILTNLLRHMSKLRLLENFLRRGMGI